MKKKILNLMVVSIILFGTLFALTGCGEKNEGSKSEEKYSDLIVAVRENTTSKEHKIGDIVDLQ